MTNKKIVLRPAASSNRRQPLLPEPSGSSRVGEVVGGTVAVCCCCPCGVVFNILLMALYKVPSGLCRRMLRSKRRRKMMDETYLQPKRFHHHCSCGCCDVNGLRLVYPMCANDASDMKQLHSFNQPDKEAIALENEMWDKFYGTGFWRSSSRRETSQNVSNNNAVALSPKTQLVA